MGGNIGLTGGLPACGPRPELAGGAERAAAALIAGKTEEQRPRRKSLPPPTKGGKVGPAGRRATVSLVERGGYVRSSHVAVADKATVQRIVEENVAREARLHTDESRLYGSAAAYVAAHERVKRNAKEYVRHERGPAGVERIHTNSAEGFSSIFKRGMRGFHQHCAEKHLHRYPTEYDFRYNHRVRLGCDDQARAVAALRGAPRRGGQAADVSAG